MQIRYNNFLIPSAVGSRELTYAEVNNCNVFVTGALKIQELSMRIQRKYAGNRRVCFLIVNVNEIDPAFAPS